MYTLPIAYIAPSTYQTAWLSLPTALVAIKGASAPAILSHSSLQDLICLNLTGPSHSRRLSIDRSVAASRRSYMLHTYSNTYVQRLLQARDSDSGPCSWVMSIFISTPHPNPSQYPPSPPPSNPLLPLKESSVRRPQPTLKLQTTNHPPYRPLPP